MSRGRFQRLVGNAIAHPELNHPSLALMQEEEDNIRISFQISINHYMRKWPHIYRPHKDK